ncbi:MAG: hypothetical protein Q3982_05340, partial [Phoenicibacter congonensis]|nr:hypothetical protein [Phoenicibacter congonensis]
GPGGSRGLQSRCGTMQNVPGVFDSHAFPPFFKFLPLEAKIMPCNKTPDSPFPDGKVRLTKLTEKGG